MSTTQRDRVWAAALELADNSSRWRRFQTRDVLRELDEPPSKKTIQRTLRAMSDLEYLEHRENSPYFKKGPRLGE